MAAQITVNVLASGTKSGAASSVSVTVTAGARLFVVREYTTTLSDSYGGPAWQSVGGWEFKDPAGSGAGTITWDSPTAPDTDAYQVLEAILPAGHSWYDAGIVSHDYGTVVGDVASRAALSGWSPRVPGENELLLARELQLTGLIGIQNYGADPPSAAPGTPTGGTYSGGTYGTSAYTAGTGKSKGWAWYATDDTSLDLTLPAINYSAPELEGTYAAYAGFYSRPSTLQGTLSWDYLPDGRRVVASCADAALRVYRYSDALPATAELSLVGDTTGVAQVSLQCRRSGIVDVVYTRSGTVYLRTITDLDAGLPAAVTIASTYQGCTHFLDEGSGMLVVPLFDSSTSTWKYVVGTLDAAGTTWSWSSVKTLVASAAGSGQVRRDRAGTWWFVYVTSANAVAAVSCRDLQSDGTGTWA